MFPEDGDDAKTLIGNADLAMFVPIAEENGAIVRIGRWVLLEACRQMQAWLTAGLLFDVVAVNISALEFGRDDFLKHVRDVLHLTGLAPHHLELELTETVLMKDAGETMRTLSELHAKGGCCTNEYLRYTVYKHSIKYCKEFEVMCANH